MPLPTTLQGEIRFVVERLGASAEGSRARAADGNDVAESLGKAEGLDYAVRIMHRLLAYADELDKKAGGTA
jgi:hypothetical protein